MEGELMTQREVQSVSAIQAIEAAAVDQQIATAKNFPRDVDTFLKRAASMISEDADRAAEMGYSLTRSGKAIVGPSIRLAEVAINAWGNLRVMIVEEEIKPGDTRVTCYGMAHDLETNVAVRIPKVRRIVNRDNQRFNEDMIATTINANVSLAYRDCAFRIIPRTFIDALYDHAMRVAGGDEETLPETRAKLVTAFEKVGVPKERLLKSLDVEGVNGITLNHVGPLRAIYDRIRRGEITADQAYPEKKEAEASSTAKDIAAGKKKQGKRKRATPKAPASAEEKKPETEAPPVEEPTPAATENEGEFDLSAGDL